MPIKHIDLNDDQRKRLKRYIKEELMAAETGRAGLLSRVRTWRRNYLSEPEQKIKTQPWYKASNVVVSITPTHTDAIHARVKNTITAFEDVWSVRSKGALGEKYTDPLSRYMHYVQNDEMHFSDNGGQILLQAVKLGTCTAKLVYSLDQRPDWTYDDNGEPIKRTLTIKDGFDLSAIDFEDCIVPIRARDPQTAAWISHLHRLSWGELQYREFNGVYRKGVLELVKNQYNMTESANREDKLRSQGLSTVLQQEPEYAVHDVHEFWAFYDINDDGYNEHICVSYHERSEELLRVVYNWRVRGDRPFVRFRYWEQEDSYYGIGVCQMLERSQEEIDMIHNQRNDNATVANMRCLKARRDGNITPGTRIFPGKVFLLDNPDEDLKDFALGEVYPSSTNNEIIARDYAERRTSINDFNLGVEAKAIQRTPAATALAVIQESNKRFDLVVRDIRNALHSMGWMVVDDTAQVKPYGKIRAVFGDADAAILREFFDLPPEAIRQRVAVDIAASSSALNKETETQKMLQVYGLVARLSADLATLVPIIVNEQVPPELRQMAAQMGSIGSEIVKRTFKLNDLVALAERLPDVLGLLPNVGAEGLPVQPGVAGNTATPPGPPGPGLTRLDQLREEIGLLPEQAAPGNLRRIR